MLVLKVTVINTTIRDIRTFMKTLILTNELFNLIILIISNKNSVFIIVTSCLATAQRNWLYLLSLAWDK